MINSSITNSNLTNTTANSIQNTSTPVSNNKSTSPSQFTKGEMLHGTITDVKNNEVSVLLEDGRQLTGRFIEQQTLSIGDKVSLQVEDTTSKMLHLKLVSNNTHALKDVTLEKALQAANLSKNEKNLSIVQELLRNKMPIDKNTILKLIQQSSTYTDVNIKDLVLMNKLDIPVTPANIQQLLNYMEGNQNLVNDLSNLNQSVQQFIDDLVNGNGMNPIDKLFSLILEEPEYSLQQNGVDGSQSTIHGEDSLNIAENLQNRELSSHPNRIENATEANNFNPLETGVLNQHIEGKEEISHPNGIGQFLTLEERQNLSSLLMDKNNPSTKETTAEAITKQILDGTISSKELLAFIKTTLEHPSSTVSKELLSSKELKEIIKNHLEEKWTLTPDEVKNKEELQAHLSHLSKQSEELKDLMAKTYQDSSFIPHPNTVSDHLNFAQQLSQLFSYIPLPLRLKEQITNGELFVYKNRGRQIDTEEGAKVLLHLDMEYLGPMDIFVEMKQKNIKCDFYFESTESVNFMLPHIEDLNMAIKKIGYQIETSLQKKAQDINPVKEQIEEEINAGSIERYNFDIRA